MKAFRNAWTGVAGTAIVAAILAVAVSAANSQTVPNVGVSPGTAPQAIPIPGTTIGQGLTWTPQQWNNSFAQKKDTITFSRLTSVATATILTTDGNAPTTTNVGTIPSGTTVQYTVQCIVLDRTNKKSNSYTFASSVMANTAGTVAVGTTNPTVTTGPTTGGGLTLVATPTIAADNTNKGWLISYTPPTSNTDPIYAQCTLELLIVF